MSANNINGLAVVILVVIFLVYIASRSERRTRESVPRKERENLELARILSLENTVGTLLAKLNEAQREIDTLRVQLATANQRIRELELTYSTTPVGVSKAASGGRYLQRPLLVVCGGGEDIFGADLSMLDGIGIRYTRLMAATQTDVADAIRTANEDGRAYKWLLVSAHASPEGVGLADGIAPPDFWMKQLTNFDVVGLAVCRGTGIAEHLRGRVAFTWYFREKVPTVPASRFVQKFFQRLNSGDDPEAAFVACIDAVSEVANYADFRLKRN
jgi:hypothetical protein